MFLIRWLFGMAVLAGLLLAATGRCAHPGTDHRDRQWADASGPGSPDPSGRAFGSPPRFEDYPAGGRFRGAPARPDLTSHPDAPRFAAALARGVQKGPNFAGGFTIVTWTCGRLCREFVIVDARTGVVHPGLADTPPISYRVDSRLIIIEAPAPLPRRVPCAGCSAAYYVWQGDHLELIPPETWVGSAPPPPVLRAMLDSLRTLERPFLERSAPSVLRPTWDRLVFAARDGSRRVLGDRVAQARVERIHVFLGLVEPIDHYLVRIVEIDRGYYCLVDASTGRMVELDALPVVSPDGARFVTASLDLVAGHAPNRIRIYRITSDGPKVEWSLEPSGWWAAGAVWADSGRLMLDSVSSRGTLSPTRPGTPIELVRGDQGWFRRVVQGRSRPVSPD